MTWAVIEMVEGDDTAADVDVVRPQAGFERVHGYITVKKCWVLTGNRVLRPEAPGTVAVGNNEAEDESARTDVGGRRKLEAEYNKI